MGRPVSPTLPLRHAGRPRILPGNIRDTPPCFLPVAHSAFSPVDHATHTRTRPLRLKTLGGPRLFLHGQSRNLGGLVGLFLGILAARGPDGMGESQLTQLIWPAGTRRSRRKRLHSLNRHLEDILAMEAPLHSEEGKIALDPSVLDTDLEELTRLVAEGQAVRAVQMVRAGFLSQVQRELSATTENWIREENLRIRRRLRKQLAQCWSMARQRGAWERTRELADALLRMDPEDEALLRRFLQALAHEGRVEEARAEYRSFRERVQSQAEGWAPEPETQHLLKSLPALARSKQALLASAPTGRPPFVGREEEMAELATVLESPPPQAFRLILITGESGVGKTRLANEALQAAPAGAWTLLRADCRRGERGIPLAPLLTAIGQGAPLEVVADLPPTWRNLILKLAPELGPAPQASLDLSVYEEGRVPRPICEAFRQLFLEMSRRRPVLLFLDDLDEADPSTAAVLQYITSRWTGGGFTVLGTLGTASPSWLSQLRLSDGAEHSVLEVARLGQDQIWDLIDKIDPNLRRNSLGHEYQLISRGLPGVLTRLLEGHPTGEDASIDQAFAHARRVLSHDLSRMTRAECALLEVLAHSPIPLTHDVLLALSRLQLDDFTAALSRLNRTQYLTSSPGGISVKSSFLQRAIRDHTPAPTRKRLVGELLKTAGEASPTNPEAAHGLLLRSAEHHLVSGDTGKARSLVLEASREPLSDSETGAARYILRRLAQTSDFRDPEISMALGTICNQMGDRDRARRHFQRAESQFRLQGQIRSATRAKLETLRSTFLSQPQDTEEFSFQLRLLRRKAVAHGWMTAAASALEFEMRVEDSSFRTREVHRLFEEAEQHLGKSGQDLRAIAKLNALQALRTPYGEKEQGLRKAQKAVAAAEQTDSRVIQLQAHNMQLLALIHLGRIESRIGQETEKKIARLVRSGGDPRLSALAQMNRAVWWSDIGQHDLADAALEDLLKSFETGGSASTRGLIQLNLATTAYNQREAAVARRRLSLAERDLGPLPSSSARIAIAALHGLLALEEGRLRAAAKVQAELAEWSDNAGPQHYHQVQFEALWHWRHGRREDSLGYLEQRILQPERLSVLHQLRVREILAQLFDRNGADEKARNVRFAALKLARDLNLSDLVWVLERRLRSVS